MTYRVKYYISIAMFAAATLYMLYIQGQVITAGYSNNLNGWLIFQMFLSFAILIVAIITFIHYRSHRSSADVTQEQLLTAATKPHDITPPIRKP